MAKIKNVSDVVFNCLRYIPETRNDDDLLYLCVCRIWKFKEANATLGCSFYYFMKHRKEMGFPSFETVRRTRQKTQADYPGLAAAKPVEMARMEKAKEFRSYALGM